MNSNATQGTAAGAYGAGAAVAVILVWLLGLHGVQVTDPVSGALGLLIGYTFHFVAMLMIGRSASTSAQTTPAKSPALTHI